MLFFQISLIASFHAANTHTHTPTHKETDTNRQHTQTRSHPTVIGPARSRRPVLPALRSRKKGAMRSPPSQSQSSHESQHTQVGATASIHWARDLRSGGATQERWKNLPQLPQSIEASASMR
jgi:hypothetical protein